MRVADDLVELASGIDALYMSGRAALPRRLVDRLAEARLAAESGSSDVLTELGGCEFTMTPRGFGMHRYQLVHRNGVVGVSTSEHIPALRVQPRAEFLHGVGPGPAVGWFRQLLEAECGSVRLTASRMDVHADWQGWDLSWDDRERFVCRADAFAMRGEGAELTGWEFGRRKTGTICGRIYDKTREMKHKGKDYWFEIWAERYRPELPVLRVEFEFGRSGLREFGVSAPEDAIEAAGGLWMAASYGWLTYRSPTADSTRSRWPVAEEWRRIQLAAFAREAQGVERMQARSDAGNLRRMAPGLVGYLSSFAALVGTSDGPDTCEALPGFLRRYGAWSGTPFSDRVAEKRRRWMLP